MELNTPLVVFDGVCNYCNYMANFAIRNDPKGRLRFTPSQGVTAQYLQNHFAINRQPASVLLIDKGRLYEGSSAAIRIAKYLRWPAKALYAFMIIPAFIRNPIYNWIARNRYKWFGQRDTCMVPDEKVRQRFLP